ncbi:hypothetical protein O1D97_08500 [Marinomonas sp. 15G1-11]|uniref:Uncharacterized protein n=1 Tax=Marinomonas phaeophyticola TaxID=3004091 RepID=A0ABT4JU00_9GAMM|nr:hypothetical protein [Marinomonas sp. 15G1-11]MCZ2721691.1 hypothetical protein [Marinomonas sp. 15G1-11]
MQPDIEIYLLSCTTESILDWLRKQFVIVNEPKKQDTCTSLTIEHNNKRIKVAILEEAAGKRFTSVWFDSPDTPWKDDIECAKQAFQELNCEVRCNFSGWEEEDNSDPDQWWCINQYKEGPFIWK